MIEIRDADTQESRPRVDRALEPQVMPPQAKEHRIEPPEARRGKEKL